MYIRRQKQCLHINTVMQDLHTVKSGLRLIVEIKGFNLKYGSIRHLPKA